MYPNAPQDTYFSIFRPKYACTRTLILRAKFPRDVYMYPTAPQEPKARLRHDSGGEKHLICPSHEKFHTVVLKEIPLPDAISRVRLHLAYFSPPEPRPRAATRSRTPERGNQNIQKWGRNQSGFITRGKMGINVQLVDLKNACSSWWTWKADNCPDIGSSGHYPRFSLGASDSFTKRNWCVQACPLGAAVAIFTT